MKLYAQHGFGDGEKIREGLQQNYIDGAIYSPKDISIDRLRETLASLTANYPRKDFYFDPQMYACFLGRNPDARLGRLIEDYQMYFHGYRRSQLEREGNIQDVLRSALSFQGSLPLRGLIAPNILISHSFDSIEAGISKDFIRLTGEISEEIGNNRSVYATLAVSREALMDRRELIDFLTDITVLDHPPTGFYILIKARNSDARDEIYHADVIAGWMMLNYSLNLNGFEVINGYSDILSPFLGAVGGSAGSTGWWSNLRTFSMNRFEPVEGGGRRPRARYLCKELLNRILYTELDQLRQIFPEILNGLPSDANYDLNQGSQPTNNGEILQSWNALNSMMAGLIGESVTTSLLNCQRAIHQAELLYDRIGQIGIDLELKSNSDHLDPLREGIRSFMERAEL